MDKGGIKGFERFIFLIRDPYDAIWCVCFVVWLGMVLGGPDPSFLAFRPLFDQNRSEYQRQMAGGHSSALTAQSFNRTHFDTRAHRFAMRYALMLDDIRTISDSVPEEDVFILRYVDLIEPHSVMLSAYHAC